MTLSQLKGGATYTFTVQARQLVRTRARVRTVDEVVPLAPTVAGSPDRRDGHRG